MPELDIYSGPAWMRQPKDQQLSLAEAFQLQQRKKEQDALLPLRQQELQQQIADQALSHTVKQEQYDVNLKMKANSAEMWGAYSQVHWDNPSEIGEFFGKVSEKGGFVDPTILNLAEKNTQLGQQYKLKEEQFKLKAIDDAAKERAINDRQQQRFAQQEKMVKLKSDLDKDAIALRSAGRAVSFDEFYNRHINKLIDQGLDIDTASKEARRVYDTYLNKGGPAVPNIVVDPKDPAALFK